MFEKLFKKNTDNAQNQIPLEGENANFTPENNGGNNGEQKTKPSYVTYVAVFVVLLLMFYIVEGKNPFAKNFETVELITKARTAVHFSTDAVLAEDVTKILNAGLAVQSGMNKQPWHFTVVSNKETFDEIKSLTKKPENAPDKAQLGDSPLAILVYCDKGQTAVFDCGLATQNMNVAALSLGYTTKIVASPAMIFKGEKKAYFDQLFKIPAGYEFVSAILIGKPDGELITDETSSATTRQTIQEKVTFVE